MTSNSRAMLSALLATRGKGGSVESITQAGTHFKADNTLTPSDFIVGNEKLEASKATTLLGGYAVACFGLEPKTVFTMRNAFAKRTNAVIDLFDGTQEEFVRGISALDAEIATLEGQKASLEISLGVDAERYIKSAQASVDKVIDGNISPKVVHDLLTLKNTIESKLAVRTIKVAQDA